MRTSELMSSAVRRVLVATDGGGQVLGERRFWGLVDTIVRNLLIDRFRRKGVRRLGGARLREDAAHLDHRRDAPDEVAASREAAVRLVGALSPEERELVELRMRGLSWQHVGDALGIAEDAARQRWASLRRKARAWAVGES